MIYLDLYEVGFFEIFKTIILPLLLVFILEMLYAGALMDISKQSVPTLQENMEGNEDLQQFFEAVISMGSSRALLLILTIAFVAMDKASSLYLWSTTFAIYYVANLMETLYSEQRLYMITSDVKTPLCFTGFGNPSDEVVVNFFVHTTLFLHVADRSDFAYRKRQTLRRCIHCLWPFLAITYLSLFMFGLVLLGANSFNQVVFGATFGLTVALILNFWLKPFFLDLQRRLTKKKIAETYSGEEVYEDRYIVTPKHVLIIIALTLVLPLTIACLVLQSQAEEIDDDFKTEVILQKIWLGNECPIDLEDASEILQYKHFACECTIVGLFGVWMGQFFEWT